MVEAVLAKELAARKVKPGFLVGRLDENVRIEDQYLLFFHRPVKLGAVGYIDQRSTTLP